MRLVLSKALLYMQSFHLQSGGEDVLRGTGGALCAVRECFVAKARPEALGGGRVRL